MDPLTAAAAIATVAKQFKDLTAKAPSQTPQSTVMSPDLNQPQQPQQSNQDYLGKMLDIAKSSSSLFPSMARPVGNVDKFASVYDKIMKAGG